MTNGPYDQFLVEKILEMTEQHRRVKKHNATQALHRSEWILTHRNQFKFVHVKRNVKVLRIKVNALHRNVKR